MRSPVKIVAIHLLLMGGFLNIVHPEPLRERRVVAGLDLFPSFLAADRDIAEKRTDDGALLLVLIYTQSRGRAERMARQVEQVETVREIPIRVEVTADISMASYAERVPAGIFLVEPLGNLKPLVRYAREKGRLLVSPFDGDVERGAVAGVHVSDRILPHVNLAAARAAGIRFKPFFLRIAKIHE